MDATMKSRAKTDTSNEEEEDSGDVMDNLERYIPGKIEPNSIRGIVMRKLPQYAIVYAIKYGNVVVLARHAKDQQHFDNTFALGRSIAMNFAKVQNPKGLKTKLIGLPEFKVMEPSQFVRVKFGLFVEVQVVCKFHRENIKMCTTGLENDELDVLHHYIDTKVGKTLVDPKTLEKSDLMGKEARVWITYIAKSYGCDWKMADPEGEAEQLIPPKFAQQEW